MSSFIPTYTGEIPASQNHRGATQIKPLDSGRIWAGLLAGGPADAIRLISAVHISRESEYNKKIPLEYHGYRSGGIMTLKKKLTLGLGFLFLIIFVLVIFYSYYIGKLSRDAANILKDNYKSLVFSKNMISALDGMRTAISSIVFNPTDDQKASDYTLKLYETGRAEFEDNLKSENNNITEIHESEYVATANQAYALYASLSRRILNGESGRALYFNEYQPASDKLRSAIDSIDDLNMQAIERKSQLAKEDSARVIRNTALIGIFCLILAFFYFWYFPFYVSNSIAYLSEKMKALLKKTGLQLDIRTNDETFIILQGIDLLENRQAAKDNREIPAAES